MATIKEDYVSFETAKLLKEKGFDGVSTIMYKENGEICINPKSVVSWRLKYWYPCLTFQMAMKWLREVHNIAIETEWEHLWYAYIKPMTSKPSEEDYYQCESLKYEEACEAAIKYCLEKLI